MQNEWSINGLVNFFQTGHGQMRSFHIVAVSATDSYCQRIHFCFRNKISCLLCGCINVLILKVTDIGGSANLPSSASTSTPSAWAALTTSQVPRTFLRRKLGPSNITEVKPALIVPRMVSYDHMVQWRPTGIFTCLAAAFVIDAKTLAEMVSNMAG